eukprot:7489590-Pyramimonas_sp.AAC.1
MAGDSTARQNALTTISAMTPSAMVCNRSTPNEFTSVMPISDENKGLRSLRNVASASRQNLKRIGGVTRAYCATSGRLACTSKRSPGWRATD